MDTDNKIILNIDGPDVTAGPFVRGISSFFKLVNEVADEIAQKGHAIEMHVSVQAGSNLIIVEPRPKNQKTSVDLTLLKNSLRDGISLLETAIGSRPRYFTDEALEYARDLANLKSKLIDKVEIRINGASSSLSSKSLASIDDILGTKHEAIGSIEGKVQILDGRNGVRCAIYKDTDGQKVTCFTDAEHPEIEDQLVSSFRKRVAAYGLIKYRKDGSPISIRVDELRTFKDPEDLPNLDQMHGIFK